MKKKTKVEPTFFSFLVGVGKQEECTLDYTGNKFIIFKSEKEDIIADILLMRANLRGLDSDLKIKRLFYF